MTRAEYLREWKKKNAERYRAGQAEWRAKNKEKIAEDKREWYRANAERIREKARRRRQEDGDALREINRNVNRKSPRDLQKDRVRAIVNRAIREGRLTPQPCEQCGVTEKTAHDGRRLIQAHHDDYSKPLKVRWLCIDCHALLHRQVA